MKTTWVTATVLQELAAAKFKAGDVFHAPDLARWVGGKLTAEQRVHATTRLCAIGFVVHRVRVIDDERVDTYTVTAEGAAAIQAAAQGHVRKSGPKTTRGPREANPQDFSHRLWQLMRVRKMLTPLEGAQTLCDAGSDEDFERRRATARKCLRRWANAGALAESARRVGADGHSNGDKRYVLLKDSVNPPRWRKPATKTPQPAGAGA